MHLPLLNLPWILGLALSVASPGFADGVPADQQRLWNAIKGGGHIVLMRHAEAPGTGDPSNFEIDDCGTQRNLSDQGRQQARGIGDRFRRNGIHAATVYSSQWCRCLETARLLGLGHVRPHDSLNSFFRVYSEKDQRTAAALELIRAETLEAPNRPPVLVTHQVNITALTGLFPASGEMLVIKLSGDGIDTVGRLR
ncbi:MAG: histidine phosphatase family protein [Thiohalocapsa sp.]